MYVGEIVSDFFFFFETDSLYNPGTHYTDQAGLELRVHYLCLQRQKACTTSPSLILNFLRQVLLWPELPFLLP